jgi:hypothetical protein
LLVGGAIKLLKTQLKLQSSPIVGTGTQPLWFMEGYTYRDNRGDTSLVPILYLSQY